MSRALALPAFVLLFASTAPSAIVATLTADPLAPQPIGSVVTLFAATDATTTNIWYRFRVREFGGEYRIVRDFGPVSTLEWTAPNRGGSYEIEVTVRNLDNGDTGTSVYPYLFRTRIFTPYPAITPTAHPLVPIYSAPACPQGSRIRVEFTDPAGVTQTTPERACVAGYTSNFPIGGLRPETEYTFQQVVVTGDTETRGPILSATTGALPANLLTPGAPTGTIAPGILLHAPLFLNKVIAADLAGRIVWYYPGTVSYLTCPGEGGRFYGIVQGGGGPATQLVREFDLLGVTLRETNAARVSEQLTELGKRTISSFHHEARPLPNDHLLVLGTVERKLTDVQGPGEVNVVGDMILVLDRDLRVVWAWDAFDHLDPARMATLGETCAQGSCPPLTGGATGNDWLHGTSVAYTPDGHLLYSSAHQDWIIKIDYNNGGGGGNILWRAGKDADFSIENPSDWFNHQNEAVLLDGNALLVFDNSVARHASDAAAQSRGQLLLLDEEQRTARVAMNVPLGGYSFVTGSAQRLPNGNFHFGSGWLSGDSSVALELDPEGRVVYSLTMPAPVFRRFRMPDLYSLLP